MSPMASDSIPPLLPRAPSHSALSQSGCLEGPAPLFPFPGSSGELGERVLKAGEPPHPHPAQEGT